MILPVGFWKVLLDNVEPGLSNVCLLLLLLVGFGGRSLLGSQSRSLVLDLLEGIIELLLL